MNEEKKHKEILHDLRKVLRVPEGENILEHAKKIMNEIIRQNNETMGGLIKRTHITNK